jgi:hypothetical protein
MMEKAPVHTPSRSETWRDAFPGISGDVIARLKARGIRSVAGAVRAVRLAGDRSDPVARALPQMPFDNVLDREAAHLFLMLQVAADTPPNPSSGAARRPRRRAPEC